MPSSRPLSGVQLSQQYFLVGVRILRPSTCVQIINPPVFGRTFLNHTIMEGLATCSHCGVPLPDDGKTRVKIRARKCHACFLLAQKTNYKNRALSSLGTKTRLAEALKDKHKHLNLDWLSKEWVERILAAWNYTCAITGQTRLATRLDIVPYRGFHDFHERGGVQLPDREWIVVTQIVKIRLGKPHLQPEQRMAMFPEMVHNRMLGTVAGGAENDDDGDDE